MIFVLIAFFKFSELSLIPFIAKLISTNILDEPRKTQLNFCRTDPMEVKIKILKSWESQQILETKKNVIEKDKIDQLSKFI